MEIAAAFLKGMVTMGFIVACLFFFRFWRRTKDSLFFLFGVAFLLLAANEAVVALARASGDSLSWVFGLRILAFVLLIMGIVSKNIGVR